MQKTEVGLVDDNPEKLGTPSAKAPINGSNCDVILGVKCLEGPSNTSIQVTSATDTGDPAKVGEEEKLGHHPGSSPSGGSRPSRAALAWEHLRLVAWRRRRCGACSVAAGLLGFALLLLLRPREPAWKLMQLEIDPAELNGFIGVVTGQTNATSRMSITAEVEFWNPNLGGATTEAGTFMIHHGSDLLGEGVAEPIVVGPRSASTSVAHVRLEVAFGAT